ncbi:MAG: UvrD-helicase domain-containing protein [Bacteroidaceae bacterium]|nr:UvrD-helicase domain-containing protein [Bacteroidaceae bacterium]
MKKIEYINAGAGSGKTYRLTHQLAEMISSGKVKPSEVIVTTFTKAAAAEIKSRARKVLLEKGMISEAAQLDSAAIGTIHSVSQMFLNKYWYAINATPEQEVLSDVEKRIYRNRSVSQLIDNADLQLQRKAIDAFYKEFQPQKYSDNISTNNPDFWVDDLEAIVNKCTYYELNIAAIDSSAEKSKALVRKIFCKEGFLPDEDFYKGMRIAYIQKAKETYYSHRTDTNRKAYHKARKLTDIQSYSNYVKLYNAYLKSGDDDASKSRVEVLLQSDYYGNIICSCIDAVFDLAKIWMAQYEQFKRDHGVIDYDDMEKGFLALLKNKDVAADIARNYKLVMVDEFQDCNPMQLKIFNLLSEILSVNEGLEQNSVWVGDPKQAIYGFRGSNTKLINRIASKFPPLPKTKEEPRNTDENGLKSDTLDCSFRSRESLVDILNSAFCQDGLFPEMTIMSADRKERDEFKHCCEQWFFEDKGGNSGAKEYQDNLARQIKDIVENQKYIIEPKDEKELRPAQYKDIAILCRKNSNINGIVAALRAEKIPVYAPEKKILDRAEVQLILSLIQLSQNRDNAHEIASILHLWNDWPTEKILASRLQNRAKDEEKWMAKGCDELKPIDCVLSHVKNLGLTDKITTLIIELSLYDKVRKWGEGEVRIQNLKSLVETTRGFEAYCSRFGIAPVVEEYITYLNSLSEFETAKDGVSDAVKVYTYHGSKGLEWPVVFLDSLYKSDYDASKFLTRDYFGVREIQKEDCTEEIIPEFELQYIPSPISTSIDVLEESYIKESPLYESTKERIYDEMKRLLYVGATRARDYLITLNFANKDQMRWLQDINMEPSAFNGVTKVFPAITPKSVKEPPVPGDKARQKTRDEYPEKLRLYKEYLKVIEDEKEYQKMRSMPMEYGLRDIEDIKDLDLPERYISPSKLTSTDGDNKAEPVIMTVREKVIDINNIITDKDGNEHRILSDKIGTCIHNIYAAFDANANDSDAQKESAERIISNYGLEKYISSPNDLIESLRDLYDWLTKRYGKATEIKHEYPFNFPVGNGQIMKGEIDLIWQTEAGDVVVDFKTHIGDPEELNDPQSPHYLGHKYIPQLTAYKQRLEQAGRTVIARVLYYNILGKAIIINS